MNLFSYESKFMQILLVITDYIILNVLYILCCIPIFTIGAAQTALYSGMRVAMDPENDESCVKAFFKGFRSGFGQITLAWCALLALTVFMLWIFVAVIAYEYSGLNAPVIISIIGIALCMTFLSMLPSFHSRFASPSFWQLLRNVWFTTVGHPLHSLIVMLLTWLPFLVAVIDLYLFMRLSIIWIAGYYSLAALFSNFVMKKTYQKLEDNFRAAQKSSETEET